MLYLPARSFSVFLTGRDDPEIAVLGSGRRTGSRAVAAPGKLEIGAGTPRDWLAVRAAARLGARQRQKGRRL
jgi:hypothetical protein